MKMDLNISDTDLAEKLRRENPEQFHTLVRMHLSFVLDLHTDENEPTNEKTVKFKKWSLFPKKSKSHNKGVMEGAPLTQEGICQVYQLIEFLTKESNISQEGIFRRTGSINRQQELRALLNSGTALDLDAGNYSVHDCASVLKGFLAELPEPLLTDAHYPAHCQIAELCGSIPKSATITNESRLLQSLQLLLLLLPTENRVLLKDVLLLLNRTASFESHNKMSADSLATLFTPHLLCPRKLTPEALHLNSQTMSGVVSLMIKKGVRLFDIPPKLATDIRAYYLEKEKRTGLLSPRLNDLNESVTDSSAANTVYSFVDRERTAQAHRTNPTEDGLAQLYAYIQSLPESSKKRKLIKQFNKENGPGTPLTIQRQNIKNLRSKSLGDSIKKHIFHKKLNQANLKKPSLLLTPISSVCMGRSQSISSSLSESNEGLVDKEDNIQVNENQTEKLDVDNDQENIPPTEKLSSPNDSLVVERISNTNLTLEESVDNCLVLTNGISNLSNDETPFSLHDHVESIEEGQVDAKNNSECEHLASYLTSTPAAPTVPSSWMSKYVRHDLSDLNHSNSVTFTPHAIGRKSMSPITRSARRMSKAMQESIMTPRSRKPVLLVSGTNICQLTTASQNSTNSILNCSNIQEDTEKSSSFDQSESKDEDAISSSQEKLPDNAAIPTDDTSFEDMSKDAISSEDILTENEDNSDQSIKNHAKYSLMLKKSVSEPIVRGEAKIPRINLTDVPESLTTTFREYLLSRSVQVSHSSSSLSSITEDEFDGDKLTESMLFCLDGNDPSMLDSSDENLQINQRKRSFVANTKNIENSKELTLKLRKLSQSGDIVYETSL